MNKKNVACLFGLIVLLYIVPIQRVMAQKHRANDQKILECIAKNKRAQSVVDSNFSAYKWAITLEKNCAKVVSGKHDAGVLFAIADEEAVVEMLWRLSKRCEPLKSAEKYLETIHEIFKKSVKTKKHTKKGELFTRKVESVSLKKYHVRKIRKRAEIVAKIINGESLSLFQKLLD
jgi:formylmethanofuran dehydrogenase subunit A